MTKKLLSSEIDPLLQKTLLCTKNAVVASNKAALHLYKKLGFIQLGVIPKGFLLKDGTYEDIIPHYLELIK